MVEKVAIVGTVPNSRRVTPCDDQSWEIWVCSPGNSQQAALPRITKWFELHSMVDMKGAENASWFAPYIAWLNQQEFPVYMQERNEEVPKAIPFPRKALLEKWGPKKLGINWFTSSITWMMAYALHLGAKEIGIFGVDFAAAEEHYTGQKAGIFRFFEIAHSMGVKVTVPLESTLPFGFPLYGYAESSRLGRAMIVRENELKEKIAQINNQQTQLLQEAAFFKGALEQVQFDRRTYVSGLDDAEVEFEDEPMVPMEELNRDALASAVLSGSEKAMDRFEQHGRILIPTSPAPRIHPPTAADFPDNPDAALLGKPKRKPNGPPAEKAD